MQSQFRLVVNVYLQVFTVDWFFLIFHLLPLALQPFVGFGFLNQVNSRLV
jgi:hypothetical protein